MAHRVRVPRRVQRQLDKLPSTMFPRIDRQILALHEEPRPPGVKKMKARTSAYRVRVGDYRILFEIDDAAQEVTLIEIANRREAYRG